MYNQESYMDHYISPYYQSGIYEEPFIGCGPLADSQPSCGFYYPVDDSVVELFDFHLWFHHLHRSFTTIPFQFVWETVVGISIFRLRVSEE